MPFRTPGSALPRRCGFAATAPVLDAFALPWLSCELHGAWAPGHTPLATGTRFSEPRRRSLNSATEFDARTHPTSRRSSRTSQEGFRPPAPGTDRCRLCWLHDALPHREPASRSLHAAAFTTALRSRGDAGHGLGCSTRGDAHLAMTRAPLVAPRAPGSPVDSLRGLDDLEAPRTGRDSPPRPPRER
jgi:hypothetical protein